LEGTCGSGVEKFGLAKLLEQPKTGVKGLWARGWYRELGPGFRPPREVSRKGGREQAWQSLVSGGGEVGSSGGMELTTENGSHSGMDVGERDTMLSAVEVVAAEVCGEAVVGGVAGEIASVQGV